MPDIEATHLNPSDDLLWIDTDRDRFLNAERKALHKPPAIRALILRQVFACFVKSDRAQIAIAAPEQERGFGV